MVSARASAAGERGVGMRNNIFMDYDAPRLWSQSGLYVRPYSVVLSRIYIVNRQSIVHARIIVHMVLAVDLDSDHSTAPRP